MNYPRNGRHYVLVLVAANFFTAGALAQPARPDGPAKELSTTAIAIAAGDSEELQLLKQRHNAVAEEFRGVQALVQAGKGVLDDLHDCLHRLGKSKLELATSAAERVQIWEQMVEACRRIEERVNLLGEEGFADTSVQSRAKYERLDAELNLLRAKKELPKPAGPAKSR